MMTLHSAPIRRWLRLDLASCFVVSLLVASPAGLEAQSGSAESSSIGRDIVREDSAARTRGDIESPCYLMPENWQYDDSIPSPREFLGFQLGELHIRHHQLMAYLQRIAEVSDRVTLKTIGQSHGLRPLVLLTITSPENHARIDDIQEAHRLLSKPGAELPMAESEIPAVINMGYSVHGDESSGGNAVPAVVYYLAASQGEDIDRLLDEVVILVDPCLNPDGFDRFAAWANANRGRVINADPNHAEHNQPWPGGRVNYYWFDLNRDWLPGQHPESQARLREYHAWKPNVVLDFHEMGTNSTFFFQPGVPNRTHPLTPSRNVELTSEIGKYHAEALDEIGTLYFTEEQFDDFYMGKGSTYPDLHGAIGILFEQASSRGHAQESNQGLVTFPFTIRNQFVCSLSSLTATLDLRDELIEHQKSYYADSLASGEASEFNAYAFRAPGDRTRLIEFGKILDRHDIECFWLMEDVAESEVVLERGETLVVPTAQPEYRFFLSLIERRTEFVENIFYDVSAWTLPLAFDLESYAVRRRIDNLDLRPFFDDRSTVHEIDESENVVAFAIPWTDYSTPRALYQLLDRGVKVRVTQKPFRASFDGEEHEFGYGTLVIAIGIQDLPADELREAILAAGLETVQPIDSGLTPAGIDLGSNNFTTLEKPEVMLVIGESVARYEAGTIWHLFDTRLKMPLSLIATSRLASTDLHRYNVIVLAGGRYSDLSDAVIEDLRRWVADGGTLVATSSSVNWIASTDLVDVTFITDEESEEEPTEGDSIVDDQEPETQKPYVSARDERALSLISGAIFQGTVDTTHPLGFGYADSELPVFRNNRIFLKPSENPYANPVIYDDDALLGGYISDENLDLVKQSASVRVESLGRGRIILMSDDPNFRAFWYGTNRLFMNAIFFGQMIRVP